MFIFTFRSARIQTTQHTGNLVTLALLIFIFEFSQDDTMASPLTASSASVIPSIALLSPPCSADTSFLGKKIERNSLAQNQQ